jgi:predicted SAM-dependent methyltransferase/tetratricopeptide (TPR) repeat protein
MGRFLKGISMFRRKKETGATCARLIRQGNQYRSKRDWLNAAAYYRKALEANPYKPAIWVQLGHALKEQGMFEDAEAAYRISLAMEPSVADTHLQLGHVLKLQSRYCEAGEAYAAALRLDPKFSYARLELDAIAPAHTGDGAMPAGEQPDVPLHEGTEVLSRLKRVRPRLAEIEGTLADIISQTEDCAEEFRAGLEALEQRVDEIDSGWNQHIPALVNAVGTVGAFGHRLAQLGKELQALRGDLAGQAERHQDEMQTIRADLSAQAERHKAEIQRLQAGSDQLGELASGQARLGQEVQALRDGSTATIRSIQERTEIIDCEVKKLADIAGRHGREFSDLWHRLEYIRSEILYEMRYGLNANHGRAIVPRLLKPEKIEAARRTGKLRLNLGCGHIALDDFINIDRRDLPGVDIVAEAGELPFEESSIHEIYSAHMLEHFPQEELRRRLLPYWISLLRPGGRFRAVVPDGEAMLANLAARTYPFEHFREVLFGAQDYEGDFHYNLLTPDSLSALLREAGLVNLEILARGRANGHCFEFEITAERPTPLAAGVLSR